MACWHSGSPRRALGFAASDETIIEQIIVTAQKRASALQDVPFSVGAATEQQIRDSGSTNIVDLARNFAGLTITDLGPGQSQVSIRGISAGQVVRDLVGGVKESVGVYLDESAISQALFTPDLDLFDLERFEVLRGPQGTLFGAGSTSGTVRYITRQPQIGEFEGAAEAGAYTGTDTDFGFNLRGVVNLPMADTAALRVVGYYNELAGFIDSVYPGRGTREDVNSGEKMGARVALLIQPNENLSITPRIVYQKLETDGYPRIDHYNILGNPFTTTQPAVNPGRRGQVTQIPEGIDDEMTLADVVINAGLGGLTLTSVTSYMDRDVVVVRDASQLTGSVSISLGGAFPQGAPIPATPAEVRLNSPLIDTTQLKTLSQEVRLASDGGDAFEWLVGAFYQDIDREYGQNLPTPGYDAFLTLRGLPNSAGFQCAAEHAVLLAGAVRVQAVRAVRRRHYALQRSVEPDRRTALLRLRRRPLPDVRRRVCRSRLHAPARLDQLGRLLAARDRGVRAERRHPADGTGRARLPSRRHQRSAERLVVRPGHRRPRDLQR